MYWLVKLRLIGKNISWLTNPTDDSYDFWEGCLSLAVTLALLAFVLMVSLALASHGIFLLQWELLIAR